MVGEHEGRLDDHAGVRSIGTQLAQQAGPVQHAPAWPAACPRHFPRKPLRRSPALFPGGGGAAREETAHRPRVSRPGEWLPEPQFILRRETVGKERKEAAMVVFVLRDPLHHLQRARRRRTICCRCISRMRRQHNPAVELGLDVEAAIVAKCEIVQMLRGHCGRRFPQQTPDIVQEPATPRTRGARPGGTCCSTAATQPPTAPVHCCKLARTQKRRSGQLA